MLLSAALVALLKNHARLAEAIMQLGYAPKLLSYLSWKLGAKQECSSAHMDDVSGGVLRLVSAQTPKIRNRKPKTFNRLLFGSSEAGA